MAASPAPGGEAKLPLMGFSYLVLAFVALTGRLLAGLAFVHGFLRRLAAIVAFVSLTGYGVGGSRLVGRVRAGPFVALHFHGRAYGLGDGRAFGLVGSMLGVLVEVVGFAGARRYLVKRHFLLRTPVRRLGAAGIQGDGGCS